VGLFFAFYSVAKIYEEKEFLAIMRILKFILIGITFLEVFLVKLKTGYYEMGVFKSEEKEIKRKYLKE
jgi:hypothetical protein